FLPGLQPEGCTKQLIEVEVGWPVAWTGRLQAREPAPQKIMRTSRRLFKTAGSRSNERGGVLGRLDAGAAPGQGHPAPLQLGQSRAGLEAKPTREVGNAGARVHRGIGVPNGRLLATPLLALVPGCLSSAVWLPGTVGMARSGRGHAVVSLSGRSFRFGHPLGPAAGGGDNHGTGRPSR